MDGGKRFYYFWMAGLSARNQRKQANLIIFPKYLIRHHSFSIDKNQAHRPFRDAEDTDQSGSSCSMLNLKAARPFGIKSNKGTEQIQINPNHI